MDTRTHITAFHLQLKSLQLTILVIQIFLMGIGGCVFGLGVAIRPILRLVKPDYFLIVRGICNGMVSVGIVQIFSAGLACLTACGKRVWTLYLAAGINLLVICLEMAGIATSMYTLTQVSEFANELIYRAWYKWECKPHGSCEAALSDYVRRYMLPQTVLAAIAVILQCLSILYLSRVIRCLNEKRVWIFKSREDLLDISHHSFDSVDILAKTKSKSANPVAGPSRRTSSSSKSPRRPSFHDSAPSFKPTTPPDANLAKYNTPNSILKGDHGYVHASNSSLNFEDNYARQSQPNSLKGTPSISFNASVEVHYFDKNKATPLYPPRTTPPQTSACVPDMDALNNNDNNNGGYNCTPAPAAHAHGSGLVCTEAASAAGLCQNVSLKHGDGKSTRSGSGSSDSEHSNYEDASSVAAHLTRILSSVRSRSRKYSFIGCTPPAPPAPPCTPIERKLSKSSPGSPEPNV